jgi:hypothetical protein
VIRHAVLLSEDVAFHDWLEPVVRSVAPKGMVSRAHPEGGVTPFRRLLDVGREDAVIFVDPTTVEPAGALTRSVVKWVEEGGRAILVGEIPEGLKGLQGFAALSLDSFAHNLGSKLGELGNSLAAVLEGRSFGHAEPTIDAICSGDALITGSRQKSEFIAGMLDALSDGGLQRTRRGRVAAVADELVMNAVYDAPNWSRRSKLFQKVDRRADVQLDAGNRVHVSWCLVKDEFQMTVSDPYGSLGPDTLYKRLAIFHGRKMVEVSRAATGGGGIGLYLVLRAVSGYRAFIVPDQLTEVTVAIDFAESASDRKKHKEIVVAFVAQR